MSLKESSATQRMCFRDLITLTPLFYTFMTLQTGTTAFEPGGGIPVIGLTL